MLATDMTASGSPEEKLRWAFKMYDKDGSGCGTCPDCNLDVGVAVQVDVNVGVIADPVVDAAAISQFMTKMAHAVSTD